ncbi:MAG: GlxA family transcriptional regulator [Ectothiorhodospiraceae bacterium]|jgi:transcriptional regulator GlxA family with amidase domain
MREIESTALRTERCRVDFVLEPGFARLSLAAAVEPLRVANYVAGAELYQWRTVSRGGGPVRDAAGLATAVDIAVSSVCDCQAVVVCGSAGAAEPDTRMNTWLQRLAKLGVCLGGLDGGIRRLAQAGVLDGHRCSVPWAELAAFEKRYTAVQASNSLFAVDRRRMTSVGGTAVLDMMLHIIAQRHGGHLAAEVSEMLVPERVRDESDAQRVPRRRLLGDVRPWLAEIVAIMEANIEEPIALDELAGYVRLSRRQLARQFKRHFGCSPSRFYLELRLQHARDLLRRTSRSVAEVAEACGFISAPHFSKCYRDRFGVPPTAGRSGFRVPAGNQPALQPAPASLAAMGS